MNLNGVQVGVPAAFKIVDCKKLMPFSCAPSKKVFCPAVDVK